MLKLWNLTFLLSHNMKKKKANKNKANQRDDQFYVLTLYLI